MADEMSAIVAENDVSETDASVKRIYEVGYHIRPTVKEEDLEKIVGGIRNLIEKANGSFIAEGAPSLTRLAYAIEAREGDKRVEYDRGYFGWIKFETDISAAATLDKALKMSADILRFVLFRTVREDTRARVKLATLREVKRTDVLKAAPRRVETSAPETPVSEEELDKALKDITTE